MEVFRLCLKKKKASIEGKDGGWLRAELRGSGGRHAERSQSGPAPRLFLLFPSMEAFRLCLKKRKRLS
jgi:hypothetical protein